MGVPKKRKSHARSRIHRSHEAIGKPTWVTCPQCQNPMTLHHVCMSCGYYLRKQVLEVKS